MGKRWRHKKFESPKWHQSLVELKIGWLDALVGKQMLASRISPKESWERPFSKNVKPEEVDRIIVSFKQKTDPQNTKLWIFWGLFQ